MSQYSIILLCIIISRMQYNYSNNIVVCKYQRVRPEKLNIYIDIRIIKHIVDCCDDEKAYVC